MRTVRASHHSSRSAGSESSSQTVSTGDAITATGQTVKPISCSPSREIAMLLNHETANLSFIRWLTVAQPAQIRRHERRPDPAAEARAPWPLPEKTPQADRLAYRYLRVFQVHLPRMPRRT